MDEWGGGERERGRKETKKIKYLVDVMDERARDDVV